MPSSLSLYPQRKATPLQQLLTANAPAELSGAALVNAPAPAPATGPDGLIPGAPIIGLPPGQTFPSVPPTADNPAGVPQGGSPAPAPSTTPATPPAPTPPGTTPGTTPPGSTSTTPGASTVTYEGDPILQQIRALSLQQTQDAQAAATAQKKQALTEFGYQPNSGVDALFPDASTKQAAQGNPFSTLAQLLYGHRQNNRNIDETDNNANLFYSGQRVRDLGNEGRSYELGQSQANSALSRLLAQIDANLLASQRNAQAQNIAGEEGAYERALQYALANGTGGSTAPGAPGSPASTNGPGTPPNTVYGPDGFPVAPSENPVPGLTPGAPIIGLPPGQTAPSVNDILSGNYPGGPRYTGGPSSSTPTPTPHPTPLPIAGSDVPGLTPGAPIIGNTSGVPIPSVNDMLAGGVAPAPSSAAQTPEQKLLALGAGPAALVNAPAPDTRGTAGLTGSSSPSWNFVRNSTSLPGNAAPAGQPALYNADDPLAAQNVSASGGTAGIWAPVHPNETPEAYAARVAGLAGSHPATLMLDLEAESKGSPGSAGYDFPAKVMAALKAAGVTTPISVTVAGGGEDDFNYKPFIDSGAMIWIQCYGAKPGPDNIDPQTAYNNMIARGVPASQIGLVLAPGQAGVPGVPSALYTIDDAPPATRSFESTSSSAAAPAATPTPYTDAVAQAVAGGYTGYVNAPGAAESKPAPAPAPAPTFVQRAATQLPPAPPATVATIAQLLAAAPPPPKRGNAILL